MLTPAGALVAPPPLTQYPPTGPACCRLAYAVNARLVWYLNCLLLPLVMAFPVAKSEAVCRQFLEAPGFHVPLARMSRA